MKTCTFFGHHWVYRKIFPALLQAVRDAVEQDGVENFYVGDKGAFDRMVLSALRILKKEYPAIHYAVVLSGCPGQKQEDPFAQPEETMLPEELAKVHPRYAIDHRNRWMVNHADMVICYVCGPIGGAAKFVESAEKKKMKIVNLADIFE